MTVAELEKQVVLPVTPLPQEVVLHHFFKPLGEPQVVTTPLLKWLMSGWWVVGRANHLVVVKVVGAVVESGCAWWC